jgi:ribosomal protein S18 acetylase RimI-like enzyme
MLGRLMARDAETLRFGRDRLRIRPWTGEPDIGHLALLTSGAAVADAFAAQAVDAAIARGYRFIRTSALSSIEAEPFLKVGFEPCQQLALLTRSIDFPSLRNAVPGQDNAISIRRARRRHHSAVLAVDHAAFDPFWHLDRAGLHDALQATPFRHFRVAYSKANPTLAGYAICGRSGPAGYLQRLAISPHQQGQGVGAALVIEGLSWMARWGATQAWVNTPMHNTGALRLYERLGFELAPPGLQVLELSVDEG